MNIEQAVKVWCEYRETIKVVSPSHRKIVQAGSKLVEIARDYAQLMADFRTTQKRLQESDRELAKAISRAMLLDQIRVKLEAKLANDQGRTADTNPKQTL